MDTDAPKHRKLLIWQRGTRLDKCVHVLRHDLPPEERFGLCSQISRTSVAIPSGIAEGTSRRGAKDFARFLGMARDALAELDTQLELAANSGICRMTKKQARPSAR